MEEEIDLREYVRVLLRWWKWIVGVTVVAAAVATAVSFLQPATYEATATVAGRKPAQATDATLSQMALSGEVLQGLWDKARPVRGADTPAALRPMLRAAGNADNSAAQLSVRAGDAEEAARVANTWAAVLAAYASGQYDQQDRQRADLLQEQAKRAQAQLDAAQSALVEFEGRNETTVLEARRASVEQDLRDSLAERRQIARAMQKVHDLQDRLAAQPSTAPVQAGDALTAVLLQVQTVGLTTSAPAVQVELSQAAIGSAGETVGDLDAFLARLAAALGARNDALKAEIDALEPQLLSLQQQVARAKAEGDRLATERSVAQNVYASAADQLARLALAPAGAEAEVASPASVPAAPAGRNRLFNVAVAGVLGLMLGVFGAFAIEWWRGGAQDEGKTGPA